MHNVIHVAFTSIDVSRGRNSLLLYCYEIPCHVCNLKIDSRLDHFQQARRSKRRKNLAVPRSLGHHLSLAHDPVKTFTLIVFQSCTENARINQRRQFLSALTSCVQRKLSG